MRSRGRGRLLLVACLCASTLPTGLFAVLGYRHALERGREEMAQAASLTAHRLDDVLDAADRTLERLLDENGGEGSDDTQRQLARIAYLSPWFREVGIVGADGRLLATSLGPLDAPVIVPRAHRSDPGRTGLQVVGRIRSQVMREVSILLAKPTPSGGEVNVLVHPDLWIGMLRDIPLGPAGFAAILGDGGHVLVSVGPIPGRVIDGPPAEGRMRSEASDPARLVRVVVDAPRAWFLRGWRADMGIVVPLFLLCNALVVGFVAYVLRQASGLDHDFGIAIARNQFDVHYQPIVALANGDCIGAEALLRWRHPEHGVVRPDVFIPIAEQTGQIEALTRWVLRRIAEESRPLFERDPAFVISVNVSPSQLADGVAARLIEDVERSGLPPLRLILEITERTLFESTAAGISAATQRLCGGGVRFALDDFGSGYSTFAHLVGMPLSWLKLDKGLLQGIGGDDRRRVVLDGLIGVGRELGLSMVAEGVENSEATGYLRERGVEYGQGWAFSPALPIAELVRWLKGAGSRPMGIAPLTTTGVQPV